MSEEREDKDFQQEEEMYEHHRLVTDPGQSPMRLDKFIHDRLEKVSRNKIQNVIKAGGVLVDDKQVKSNYQLKPGQVIRIVLPNPPQRHDILAEDIPIDIVYEDESLMVINKKAGMVVHPGHGNRNGTLVNALKYYLDNKVLPVKSGNNLDRPGLVHRIDKDTSGLLVIAKTEYAMTHLANQFFTHEIERAYQAIVWGQPEDEGKIEGNIGRHPNHRIMMTVFPEGESGKPAVTHYKMIEPLYYVSLVECRLETGRTHQIRVHMKYLGHPLFNDSRYGGDKIVKGTVFSKYKSFVENTFKHIPRQALHAKSLGFIHPDTNEKMTFDSELPDDMLEALERWRNYVSYSKDKLS